MRIPIGNSTWTKICSFIVRITDGKFAKYIIKPILFTAIPTIILQIPSGSVIKAQALLIFPEKLVDSIIDWHLLIIFFTVLVVGFISF